MCRVTWKFGNVRLENMLANSPKRTPMNAQRLFRTLLLTALCLACSLAQETGKDQVKTERHPGSITISNSKIKRQIRYSEKEPGGIFPASFVLIGPDKQLINVDVGSNWFELPLNNRSITNQDRCWRFEGHVTRQLANKGLELRFRFRGVIEPVRSLNLDVLIQLFENSTVCREKIIFSAAPERSFKLTSEGNGPLLVFPAYVFKRDNSSSIETSDLKMASWGRDLLRTEKASSFDERTLEGGSKVGRNLAQNYMYHPSETRSILQLSSGDYSPAPIVLAANPQNKVGVLFAYEHGAPDDDPEQEYVVIQKSLDEDGFRLKAIYTKGLYYSNQTITDGSSLESPWNVVGFFEGSTAQEGKQLLWEYLNQNISESDFSRRPYFYYNTWGMQRDEERRGKDVRGVLTKESVLEEIESSSLLNIDIFVLDDGWQDRFGDWNPDPARYSDGLRWYVQALKKKGIMPGLWIAALATDPEAEITKKHPEWLVKDENDKPVVARWQRLVFCFDSDYRDYFIKKCKERIDEGIRYFKWDGIDKHLCSSPYHHHGNAANTPEERRQNQGFDLPLLVADAIRQLKQYQPDVIVEVDVTEPHRSVGLAILSQGKYFWMNNGASWYGDYSTYRAKSTRFVSNLYHSFIPSSLQTFANYPHNNPTYSSFRYNVNSSLIGGKGFWGNLSLMNKDDLERVGKLVSKSKRVLSDISGSRPVVTGSVGGSPEIYECVNKQNAAGQIVGFSGSALTYDHVVAEVRRGNLLAVLNNAYSTKSDSLVIHFVFGWPETSREAFLIPNEGKGISIISSTSWIDDARIVEGNSLVFVNGAPGSHVVEWRPQLGSPDVTASQEISYDVRKRGVTGTYEITITSKLPFTEIKLRANR